MLRFASKCINNSVFFDQETRPKDAFKRTYNEDNPLIINN